MEKFEYYEVTTKNSPLIRRRATLEGAQLELVGEVGSIIKVTLVKNSHNSDIVDVFEDVVVLANDPRGKKEKTRKRLTDKEFTLIQRLTKETKIDTVFDVKARTQSMDAFRDFENDKWMSLKDGLTELYEALAYPLSHEGFNKEDSEVIVSLFKEFGVGNKDGYEWLLSDENGGKENENIRN